MKRILLLATAAAVAVGTVGCSSMSRQTSRYGTQPPAGTAVETGHLSANPTPEVSQAAASEARASVFDLKKGCQL
jgi:hypothetical protein